MTYHYVTAIELKANPERWLAAAHKVPVLINLDDGLVLVLIEYATSRDSDVDFMANLPFKSPERLDECLAAARIAPVLVEHDNTALVLSNFVWPRDEVFDEFISDIMAGNKRLIGAD